MKRLNLKVKDIFAGIGTSVLIIAWIIVMYLLVG